MTGVPLDTPVQEMSLEPKTEAALLGREENEYTRFLQYILAYDAPTGRMILPDLGLRLNKRQVSTLYMECISETDAAFSDEATVR